MKRTREEERQRIFRIAVAVGGTLMIVVIVWIDIATGIWQNLVILSGLAAGFVSFFLTSLILKSVVTRATAKHWAPVNRIAITEFLHAIADEDRSEVAHGLIVPRTLPEVNSDLQGSALLAEIHELREIVAAERRELSDALSRWATILTSTGDNEVVLMHVARIAFQLDRVRDLALELASHPSPDTSDALTFEVSTCNEHFSLLVEELKRRLKADDEIELTKRQRAATA